MSVPSSYEICVWSMNHSESLSISAADFADIQSAAQTLQIGVGVEEKFDILVENYSEFVRVVLDVAFQMSLAPGRADPLLENGGHLANRRLANFLTTARMYLDQIRNDVSRVRGKESPLFKAIEDATHHEYDAHVGYRVMEALRNYVQHRSLLKLSMSSSVGRDEGEFRCDASCQLGVAALITDTEVKKQVRDDLSAAADREKQVQLLPLIQEYMESLARIQEIVRREFHEDLEAAGQVIEGFRSRARSSFGRDLPSLIAASCGDRGVHLERERLSTFWAKRRRELKSRNSHIDSISRRYLTTKSA